MKKIVRELVEKEVSISSIKNKSIIGIDWGDKKTKVVTKGYKIFFSIELLCDDFSVKWVAPSKMKYVDSALKQSKKNTAYEFNSQEELLEWMLK